MKTVNYECDCCEMEEAGLREYATPPMWGDIVLNASGPDSSYRLSITACPECMTRLKKLILEIAVGAKATEWHRSESPSLKDND